MRLYVPVQIITHLCTSFDVSRVINYLSTRSWVDEWGACAQLAHMAIQQEPKERERGLWSHLIKSAAVIYTNPDRCSPPPNTTMWEMNIHTRY